MATPTKEINQVIRVGNTLTNLIDKQTKQIFTADKVTTYYDGTPMTDAKVDGYIYRKAGSEYFLKNLGKYGELFLEKDTVDQLRELSATEVLLLKMKFYKGVTLNGYYNANDTPAPIQYYLSDTTDSDDNVGVFEIGGIKLEHIFKGVIHSSYLGIDTTGQVDCSTIINKYILQGDIELQEGFYLGRFIIDTNNISGKGNVELLYNGIIDDIVVRLQNGSNISNIKINGQNIARIGVLVSGLIATKYSISKCEFYNLYGVNQQSNGIYVSPTTLDRETEITYCNFYNIDAEIDGSIGNSKGASRGIVISGTNGSTKVNKCKFHDIGTFEDGDCITVQSEPHQELTWANLNVLIDDCLFTDIKKRGIKIQCSGVVVNNVTILSTHAGEGDQCVQAAIDIFGSNNIVKNSSIIIERGTQVIQTATGKNNKIYNNEAVLDPNSLYPNARGNNVCSGIRVGGENNHVFNNKVSAPTWSLVLQNSDGARIFSNDIEGRVQIIVSVTNSKIYDNSIFRKSIATGLTYGFVIQGINSNDNNEIINNKIKEHSYGFLIGQSASETIQNRLTVLGNLGVRLVNDLYIIRSVELISCLIGGLSEDTGFTSFNIHDSNNTIDVNNCQPDKIYYVGTTSINTPPPTGIVNSAYTRWWRIVTKRMWRTDSSTYYQLKQEAIAVSGTASETFGEVRYVRYLSLSGWSPWSKTLQDYDFQNALETNGTSMTISSVFNRIINASTSRSINVQNDGKDNNSSILIYNDSSTETTLTLTGAISKTIKIPANSQKSFILQSFKGKINMVEIGKEISDITDITTPNATDEASAIILANDNKAKINQLLSILRG